VSIFIVNQCNHDPERKICSECQKINKINELQTQQRTTRKLLEHAEESNTKLKAKNDKLEAQLDNHRAQTDHWLTMLDKAEAQLEAVRKLPDEWVHSGNGHYYGSDCAEQLQAILNKAAIGEDES